MKNESADDMWAELKSSKPKMIFMTVLVVGALAAVFSKSVEIPGLKAEHINLSYDQVMDQIYLSGLTSAQEADKKSQFVGKRVTWTGTVIDVEPGYRGNMIELSEGGKGRRPIISSGKFPTIRRSHSPKMTSSALQERSTD